MSKNITIKQCVEFAIKTEAEMSLFYDRLAKQCEKDDQIASLFRTLSMDEALHKKQFEIILKTAEDEERDLTRDENDFFNAMSLSMAFSDLYNLKNFIYHKDKKEKLLQDLFEFEKATYGFYAALKEIMGHHTALRDIVNIEKRHVVAVMKLAVTGTQFTSMADNWA